MPLLFLDFDGVLHPQYDGQPTPADKLFCHLGRFEEVIRSFPNVEIVISSMWRYHFSLEELRERFSPDIRPRIIDATPQLKREGGYLPAEREKEIVAWLVANDRLSESWVAIDDAHWQFIDHVDRLIACRWYEGLCDTSEAELRLKLAEMVAKQTTDP